MTSHDGRRSSFLCGVLLRPQKLPLEQNCRGAREDGRFSGLSSETSSDSLQGPRDLLFSSSSLSACGRPRPAASSFSGESRGGCYCLWSALQPHKGAGRTRRRRDGRGSRIFWKGAARSATRALKVNLPASWPHPRFPLFPVFLSSWFPVPSQPRFAQA